MDIFRDAFGRWFERLPAGGIGGGVSHTFHRLLSDAEAAAHEAEYQAGLAEEAASEPAPEPLHE